MAFRFWSLSSLLPHLTHFCLVHSLPDTLARTLLCLGSHQRTDSEPASLLCFGQDHCLHLLLSDFSTHFSFPITGTFMGLSYIASELSSLFYLLTCFIIFLWPYNLFLLSFSARWPSPEQKFCVGEDMKTAAGELSSQQFSIQHEWGQWLLHECMHIWEDGMFWEQITYIQIPPLPSPCLWSPYLPYVCTASLFVDGMNICSGLSLKLG